MIDKIMNHDGRHPLEILPMELWEAVFGKLTTPFDLLSCAKVSPAWEGFLKYENPWMPLAETFKFLLPYLDTRTKLVCRRICHPLTEVVDNLLCRQNPMILRTKLESLTSFNARIQKDRNNKTKFGVWNPSLWNSIAIKRVHQGDVDWRLRVLSCLVRRGKQVAVCEVTLTYHEEPLRELFEILTYLPNLKELIVVCKGWRYGPTQWKSVDDYSKLPPLKCLEIMRLISMCPSVARRLLDRYGSQLKKCEVSH